jgi:TPR repeat protein
MQPELPWNVAGISSDTREAIRAAARREGLSLGEWMTRQIVRGFPNAGNGSAGTAPAETFEQMSAQMDALAGRLSALERQVQSGPMRQAVTALHQGLSRVADDVAAAAGKSAAQIAAIAADVEALAAAQAAQSSPAARIEEAIAQLPPRDLDGALERRLQAIEQRLSGMSYGESRNVPPPGTLGESFAASEGFLGKPVSFLNAPRRAAIPAMSEGKTIADENGEAPSAWRLHRKRSAVVASVFAAAAMAVLGGVVLTGGKSSTAHAVPAITVGQQSRFAVAAASNRRTAAAERHSGVHKTQIAVGTVTDASAIVPSISAGALTSAAAATVSPVQVKIPTPSVSPNAPGQRIAALANMGNPRAQLLIGLKYLDGNGAQVNEAEAARWLARAAQQGEPLAQYRLGTLYERGRGVPPDASLAVHWYGLAAAQGNRKAMHNLAVAFAEGSGAPKNDSQAALWFQRAADLGLADSQFNLAVLYERGMGVKQSLENAYRWYLIAAAQGDAESKSRAEALATQLKDSERGAGQRAAAAFRQQPLTPAANSLPVLG